MKRMIPTNGAADDPELPGSLRKDFVVVDDLGDFTYYPSETAMLEDMESVNEAASIFDRAGNDFRLTLEGGRTLRLSHSFGRVEFTWLRQTWMNDRRRDPEAHRLLRFYPTNLDALLTGIFETLTLEIASEATDSPWLLDLGGKEAHPATLREVDGLLARLDHLERVTVRDPFGHNYRPTRHAPHPFRTLGAGTIYYVETEPGPGAVRRPAVSDSLP
ncbi:hypothetical protein [Arthrobacter sp. MA-N2]|uniref:hypothetical protein n=1 Tax=Arthrobacter sp. MA-N2 TaxID=1101188 RepID=UPI0004B1C026|nr:hypothetical protein [Arthrobacter sp. MA-N2]